MYCLMAYNNDRDIYNEICSGTYSEVREVSDSLLDQLRSGKLCDETGESYDWMEIWNDEDDNGYNDEIIS